MTKTPKWLFAALLAGLCRPSTAADLPAQPNPTPQKRNVILFVADGLRPSAINPTDMPAMATLRDKGVNFTNSHALFPTFTTANAGALATGHFIGDTGNFSYSIYSGYPNPFNQSINLPLEFDPALQDLDEHFPNRNYMSETSLLGAARAAGFHTAAIGKHGPVLIQDVTQNNMGTQPTTVIIDDLTGTRSEVPLPPAIAEALRKSPLANQSPERGEAADSGAYDAQGALVANVQQQRYFIRAAVDVVLPTFVNDPANHNPFVMVYWSRDPDGTQHGNGDNFNKATGQADQLGVGINGPTVRAALKNVDDNLAQLLQYLDKTDDPQHPGAKLAANTDIVIVSDHGFGTISKHDLSMPGADGKAAVVADFAATQTYYTAVPEPMQDTVKGFLPTGFVAIDLAEALHLPMFDPDQPLSKSQPRGPAPGVIQYIAIDPNRMPVANVHRQHSRGGATILGGTGKMRYTLDAHGFQFGTLEPDAKLVTVGNGGSELIYVPNPTLTNGKASPDDIALVRRTVQALADQSYVGAIFVDTVLYGKVPGALSLSDVGLKGNAQTPTPAIIISFSTFAMDSAHPLHSGVEIADTGLQHGQGMHGSFARFDTCNTMLAFGPDFAHLQSTDPASNADVAPTLAYILGLKLSANGNGIGRVLDESLAAAKAMHGAEKTLITSDPAPNGFHTDLRVQTLQDAAGQKHTYFDWAGMPGRVVTGE